MLKRFPQTAWSRNSTSLRKRLQVYDTVHRKQISSLSPDEFSLYFKECVPHTISGNKIAVAFSGGPDSTCLLYLLKELTKTDLISRNIPKSVVAITIDHDLQACSSKMTEQCAQLAQSIGVQHLTLKIPWGEDPFPPHPSGTFEKLAREARYHLLLQAMIGEGINTIAFGHHLDDQVETALLRLANGSGLIGAAGMRPQRLWGMGFGSGPGAIGWAGQHGMDRWIIRPLLGVPKERIIATCKESELDYVVDPTNSRPDIALRNQLRYSLQNGSTMNLDGLASGSKKLFDMAANVSADLPAQKLNTDSGPELVPQLQIAVQTLSTYVGNLNNKVSLELKRCLRPSPVSTILLASEDFSRIVDNTIRLEVVRRILRYVSPFPWGSRSAEAGQRSASLQRIVEELSSSPTNGKRRKLAGGGGALWTPVLIDKAGKIKYSGSIYDHKQGWLISRQPPIRRYEDQNSDALELDITSKILRALESQRPEADSSVLEILYDCRFIVHIRTELLRNIMTKHLTSKEKCRRTSNKDTRLTPRTRILLVPHTRYFLPKVVLRTKNEVTYGEGINRGLEYSQSEERYQLPSPIKTQEQSTRRAGMSEIGESDPETELEIARLSPDGKVVTTMMAFDVLGEDNKSVETDATPDSLSSPVRIDCVRILDTAAARESLPGWPFGK